MLNALVRKLVDDGGPWRSRHGVWSRAPPLSPSDPRRPGAAVRSVCGARRDLGDRCGPACLVSPTRGVADRARGRGERGARGPCDRGALPGPEHRAAHRCLGTDGGRAGDHRRALLTPRATARHWLLGSGGVWTVFLAVVVLALPHGATDAVVRTLGIYALVFGVLVVLVARLFRHDMGGARGRPSSPRFPRPRVVAQLAHDLWLELCHRSQGH